MTEIDPNNIAPNILQWVEESLKIDHPPPMIRDRLKHYGYTTETIKGVMKDKYPEEDIQMNFCYDYAALANPRLVQDPAAVGAVAVDTPAMQLYIIEDFINRDACDELAALCRKYCEPSTTDLGRTIKRTSSTCYLAGGHGAVVDMINTKMAETIGINNNYSEGVQGQVYTVQQEFKRHVDYQTEETIMELHRQSRLNGQRTWTFTVYLNNPRRGGETEFTDIGISIEPKPGKAVIWNNLLPNGQPNSLAMHRGCPVGKGSKVILTKWFRQHGFGNVFL